MFLDEFQFVLAIFIFIYLFIYLKKGETSLIGIEVIRLVLSIQLDFIFLWKQVTLKYLSYWIFKECGENWNSKWVWKSSSAIEEDNLFLVWCVDLEKNISTVWTIASLSSYKWHRIHSYIQKCLYTFKGAYIQRRYVVVKLPLTLKAPRKKMHLKNYVCWSRLLQIIT